MQSNDHFEILFTYNWRLLPVIGRLCIHRTRAESRIGTRGRPVRMVQMRNIVNVELRASPDFMVDTGPDKPDLCRTIAFEDLPKDCQECLPSGGVKRKLGGKRGN